MKLRTFLSIALLIACSAVLFAWGFYGHRKINNIAVFTLPADMFGFYKANINYLTRHAVDPDIRRHTDKKEAPRHYIDLDLYEVPLDSLPYSWPEAVGHFSEDTLMARGILPWHISRVYYQLIEAFKVKDEQRILRLSADIGHYIGDAHVPLHTTSNYDGQLTGQKGIHAFWESRIPELFGEDYDYFVGKAIYIDNPAAYVRAVIKESNNAVDSVLRLEKAIRNSFTNDAIYAFEERGGRVVRQYSRPYANAYNKAMEGMVERRMRSAIIATGSMWMSAWIDAGQPILDFPLKYEIEPEIKEEATPNEHDCSVR